jgi:hypothetical protein
MKQEAPSIKQITVKIKCHSFLEVAIYRVEIAIRIGAMERGQRS